MKSMYRIIGPTLLANLIYAFSTGNRLASSGSSSIATRRSCRIHNQINRLIPSLRARFCLGHFHQHTGDTKTQGDLYVSARILVANTLKNERFSFLAPREHNKLVLYYGVNGDRSEPLLTNTSFIQTIFIHFSLAIRCVQL